jgi:hypothetical protein
MLTAVEEGALVDRAVVILLGDDLPVLREDRQGKQAEKKGKAAHRRLPGSDLHEGRGRGAV